MTLTVIYIILKKWERFRNDWFYKYRRITKMTYGVWGVYEIQYNKTATLAKTVEQQVFCNC